MTHAVQVVFGLILIFFLPGFLFVQALFPRKRELDKEFDWLYRITLAVGMSIVIVILLGLILGSIPPDEETGKGYFQGSTKGEPYIEISLLSISAILFVIGWYRGAYPFLGRIHPSLARAPPGIKIREGRYDELSVELETLAYEREKLRRRIKKIEKSPKRTKSAKEFYERKMKELEEELKDIEGRIKQLEEKRAEQLSRGEE